MIKRQRRFLHVWNKGVKYCLPTMCVGLLAACASMAGKSQLLQEKPTSKLVVDTQPASNSSLAPQPAASKVQVLKSTNQSSGDVADLMQLVHEEKLDEMRTTYNGTYGASLFFWPAEMTYYVALFQGQRFWRVLKVEDEARAERIYTSFVDQTWRLGDLEIQRAKLEAQKNFLKRAIALSEDREKRLQADLDIAREQQENVDGYQRATKAEALVLKGQKEDAQARLRQIQQQIEKLQNQAENGLPGSK
jgi:hypothetical protein